MKYAELCSKSCFSFLQAASHPEELVRQAHSLGYSSLALNDYNGFYGMVRAYEASKETGFPIAYGTEISIEETSLCLIAKNLRGYRQLCRLVSEGFHGKPKGKPAFHRYLLEKWLSDKEVFIFLCPRNYPSPNFLSWLRERYFLHQFVTKRLSPNPDQEMKSWLKSLAKEIPRVWTWDTHFHHPSRLELLNVLHAIRDNTPLSQRSPLHNAENYLKPLSALEKFQVPKEWIEITNEIAESCEFSPSEIKYLYPQEWLPKGKKAYEFLNELCEKGLKKRYPRGASPQVLQQLKHELQLIKELQYEDYFLTVWDIVQFARSQKILCQGRGSAANSIICYLLEITSIDPIQMNLLFERFISKERNEAPDIDVDFEHERREEVIQYIYKKYGRHRAGMVATLITYRTKGALRDVGKALGIPLERIDYLSKQVRWRENVFETEKDPQFKRLFRIAQQLKGFPRHLGQHTGGMILCQDRLDEISPIEPASMEGRSVVQWDKYDVEKLGLLKIDILSLGMLTCIRKAFDTLRENKIADIELHRIPHNDPKTYEMISQSKTVGVFQIESRAQMSMLPRLKPRNFYDLVIEVAIVRPGPIQGGMIHPYLRRRMGVERVEYAHPLLEPILKKTLGVPIFQEQVMKMAIEVAGYSPGEADALRRAMGAWRKRGNLEDFARDIQNRLIGKGISPDFSERICRQILGFGEYGFPESHAASFALLTYASSYLKANYPYAFLCSLLNSMPMGFYPFHVLTSSFLREGVQILPVSLEKSDWDHKLEYRNNIWHIRLGFRCVKSLQKEHVMQFISARSGDPGKAFEIFNSEEKASLAMIRESQRRLYYWKALQNKDQSLNLGEEKKIEFKEPDPLQNIIFDLEFMQSTLNEHPVSLVKKKYWNYAIPTSKLSLAKDFDKCRNSQSVLAFGMLQIIQSPPTAKGMFFITTEDESGFLNLVLTPQTWKKYKHLIKDRWMLLVRGKLQRNQHYHSLLIQEVIAPAVKRNNISRLSKSSAQKKPYLPPSRVFENF